MHCWNVKSYKSLFYFYASHTADEPSLSFLQILKFKVGFATLLHANVIPLFIWKTLGLRPRLFVHISKKLLNLFEGIGPHKQWKHEGFKLQNNNEYRIQILCYIVAIKPKRFLTW